MVVSFQIVLFFALAFLGTKVVACHPNMFIRISANPCDDSFNGLALYESLSEDLNLTFVSPLAFLSRNTFLPFFAGSTWNATKSPTPVLKLDRSPGACQEDSVVLAVNSLILDPCNRTDVDGTVVTYKSGQKCFCCPESGCKWEYFIESWKPDYFDVARVNVTSASIRGCFPLHPLSSTPASIRNRIHPRQNPTNSSATESNESISPQAIYSMIVAIQFFMSVVIFGALVHKRITSSKYKVADKPQKIFAKQAWTSQTEITGYELPSVPIVVDTENANPAPRFYESCTIVDFDDFSDLDQISTIDSIDSESEE